MRPIGDRLLVQETTTQDDRHIWTPDGTLMTKRGVVLAIGALVHEIDVGEVVLYPENWAVKVPVEGDLRVHVISEDQVMVVMGEGE